MEIDIIKWSIIWNESVSFFLVCDLDHMIYL